MVNGALDPSQVQQLGEQASMLHQNYGQSTALLRLQRAQLQQQFGHQKAAVREQGRYDMQSAAGAAAERGVLGSSSDASARAQVKAGTASQVIAARDALRQGKNANLGQLMSTRMDYRSGLIQLAAQRDAQRAMGASSRALDGTLDRIAGWGTNVGGPKGDGTGPKPGTDAATVVRPGQQSLQEILQQEGGIGGLNKNELNKLRDRQLRRLHSGPGEGMIDQRIQNIWDRKEAQGNKVWWQNGKMMTSAGGGRGPAEVVRRGTQLKKRRDWVKLILGGNTNG